MGSSSSPRTLLEAMAWASRGWPSKLCSTRRIGCMLASLQTIKISAPLKPTVDSASTPSKPDIRIYIRLPLIFKETTKNLFKYKVVTKNHMYGSE